MKLSRFVSSAVAALDGLQPSRLAAGASAAVGFVMGLVLLRLKAADMTTGSQLAVANIGAFITAILCSQLAAYIVSLLEGRGAWPAFSPARRVATVLAVALLSAGLVLAIMLLVS